MHRTIVSLGLVGLFLLSAQAATHADLTELSLEELMQVEITSVAKKKQRLANAAAAIFVLTNDDIRRSAATTVPELLRMVPGVNVARIDGNRWSVSIRGFTGRFSSKLLVLIDGRSVYTPLFSGVYWESQNTLLQDIERIEVIRGPGGTLWGANAVNGVINIITKNAAATQDNLLQATAGNGETGLAIRSGGKQGHADYRFYLMARDSNELEAVTGFQAHDGAEQVQGGFRLDYSSNARDSYTLQGDIHDNRAEQNVGVSSLSPAATSFVADTARLRGANLLFRWKRKLSDSEEWQWQAYYDRYHDRDIILDQFIETADIEFQHRFALTEKQELTWGLGYRYISDRLLGSFTVSFTEQERQTALYNVFLQDEIQLSDAVQLTVGSKFEHSDFNATQALPSMRLLWKASEANTVWAAVSKAVRNTSRSDYDAQINYLVLPGPTVLQNNGSTAFEAEEVISTEIGYRSQLSGKSSFDITAFYNVYDKLRSREADPVSPPPPYTIIGSTYGNLLEATSWGAELSLSVHPLPDWRVRATYSGLRVNADVLPGGQDTAQADSLEANAPRHMFTLQSSHRLGENSDLDINLYRVDELPALGSALFPEKVDAYTRLDVRMAWRPLSDIEFILAVQNMLGEDQLEYIAQDTIPGKIPRSAYARLNWTF